jgi:hypothetical protein
MGSEGHRPATKVTRRCGRGKLTRRQADCSRLLRGMAWHWTFVSAPLVHCKLLSAEALGSLFEQPALRVMAVTSMRQTMAAR